MGNGWTFEKLLSDIGQSCLVKPGQILIVHSSLKAVGPIDPSPLALVDALKAALTPEGTLMMPVFVHPQDDGIFDVRSSPSRTGKLTEIFRTQDGTIRSKHPTHSFAAWGRRAEELMQGHDQTSAVGPDSPLHKAAKAGAKVLMIGCKLTSCTLIHLSETLQRTPYMGNVVYEDLGYRRQVTLVDYDGSRRPWQLFDSPGDSAGFTVVQDELQRRGSIHHGRLGQAECLHFDAAECLSVAVDLLRKDPAALLCSNPNCCVCPPSRKICEQSQPQA